jgi:hypothetical protein
MEHTIWSDSDRKFMAPVKLWYAVLVAQRQDGEVYTHEDEVESLSRNGAKSTAVRVWQHEYADEGDELLLAVVLREV